MNLPRFEDIKDDWGDSNLIPADSGDYVLYTEAQAQIDALRAAFETFLTHYIALVESGDCGNWDAEKEPQVIAARAALDATKEQG